jgi:hypothetical protein
VSSTWSIGELKTRFGTWITRNDVNGVSLFHLHYLITLMAYLWSQWTTNVQIKYFLFDWWIYRLFMLNSAWKHDSLQIMKFVNMCSKWSMGQLKTRFETWITRYDVSLFRLFFITLIAYVRSQRTTNFKTSNLCLTDHSTDYLCYLGAETQLFPNNNIRICLLDIKHNWTSKAFWEVNK